jgi:HlyD family secretion protein
VGIGFHDRAKIMSEVQKPLTGVRARSTGEANGQTTLSERVRSLRLGAGGHARPRSAWLPWGLTLIALATAALFGWRTYRLSPADMASAVLPEASAPAIKTGGVDRMAVVQAAAGEGEAVLDAKGYVIATHQIQVSPRVGGEIIWLDPNFREGAVYKKGDRLAEIDPVIYAARLKAAQAVLRVAETNLKEVESGSALAEIQAAKAQLSNLASHLRMAQIDERTKRSAGSATPREDLEKAAVQTQIESAAFDAQKRTVERLETALSERLAVAKAQILKAQAEVEEATKLVQDCTITAPTTGVILTKKAELGGYVNPLAFGAAGYLCEMADLKDLEVELDIQERDISRVRPGQRCRIMPEAGQRDEAFLKVHPQGYSGFVSRRMPVANRAKGAVTVRVKIEIPADEEGGAFLLPDMGALVTFLK